MNLRIIKQLIILILFIIPFFWLKPGEMDLGGDSSRLYFYDPFSYLKNVTFYGITPDGIKAQSSPFSQIPFVIFIAFLKTIFRSSYLTITIFNSISLILAYIGISESVRLILEKSGNHKSIYTWSSIYSGLVYVFFPALTPAGWDKAMYVHNQFFIYPMILYLSLLYLEKRQIYLISFLLLFSSIFSVNFSITPSFIAFFVLFIPFIMIYIFINHLPKINKFHFIFFIVGFLTLHAFHLYPFFVTVFDHSSSLYKGAFTAQGQIDRGLSYFVGISKTVRLYRNLLGLPHGTKSVKDLLLIIVPLIMILPIAFNKNIKQKYVFSYISVMMMMLIAVFFLSAKVTNTGFYLYKKLFVIPGFSMFRNYIGQFAHVTAIYMCLGLGIATSFIFEEYRLRKVSIFLSTFLLSVVIYNAIPFIRGDMIKHLLNPQSKTPVYVPITIDPEFEESLSYIKNMDDEQKMLTVPLTDFGWQMVSGKEGGAYQGPSFLPYIAGKPDFAGIMNLIPLEKDIQKSFLSNNKHAVQTLFGYLNIGYIFHNSDPRIYDTSFNSFPYKLARVFLPLFQNQYTELINTLDNKIVKSFDQYHIYKRPEEYTYPLIYSSQSALVIKNDELNLKSMLGYKKTPLTPIILDPITNNTQDYTSQDHVMVKASNTSLFNPLYENRFPSVYPVPFASHAPGSVFYRLIKTREYLEIKFASRSYDNFFDKSVQLLTKRAVETELWPTDLIKISTLEDFKKNISSLKSGDKNIISLFPENSWELALLRYYDQANQLIISINNNPKTIYSNIVNNKELSIAIARDIDIFYRALSKTSLSTDEKSYLVQAIKIIHKTLESELNIPLVDVHDYNYSVIFPTTGLYDILTTHPLNNELFSDYQISNNKETVLKPTKESDTWVNWGTIEVKENRHDDFKLKFSSTDKLKVAYKYLKFNDQLFGGNNVKITVDNSVFENPRGSGIYIPSYGYDDYYDIEFEYKTGDGHFYVTFYEFNVIDQIVQEKYRSRLFSKDWEKYIYHIKPGGDAKGAYITFTQAEDSVRLVDNNFSEMSLELKNLSVTTIPQIELYARKKILLSETTFDSPKIYFQRVNPTLYNIRVDSVNGPYWLVFLNNYDSKWKIYLGKDTNNHSPPEFFWMFVGSVFKNITKWVLAENNNEPIISRQYSKYNISEGGHTNKFLTNSVFNNWGKPTIADETHLKSFNYANAWLITPKETDNLTSYQLTLEYIGQRPIYILLLLWIANIFVIVIVPFIYRK